LTLDDRDVRNAGCNRRDLRPRNFGVRGFATAEADLHFHFVTIFQETARRAHADLQIVLVGAGPQSDLLDLRDMLVLLGITRALVLLEPEPPQVRDATNGRVCSSGHLDEVEAGLLGSSKGVLNRNNADLSAFIIDDTDLRYADLTISARTGRGRRPRIKGSARYGAGPPCFFYFFFGPLLTIGGLGVDFVVRLPPLLDMSLLLVRRSKPA